MRRLMTEMHQPRFEAGKVLVVDGILRTVNQVRIHHSDSASSGCRHFGSPDTGSSPSVYLFINILLIHVGNISYNNWGSSDKWYCKKLKTIIVNY
jgi:hypothetical protein